MEPEKLSDPGPEKPPDRQSIALVTTLLMASESWWPTGGLERANSSPDGDGDGDGDDDDDDSCRPS